MASMDAQKGGIENIYNGKQGWKRCDEDLILRWKLF
jgi:hypothetical protein